ncbi:DUF4347 domain-containing protein [Rubripirellula reticaptiva]|uniref:Cadherin domain protein n=1 Tax=Rubripirellula reticaptiva TaxID=2528013 RepID=A0A5C6ENM2_9BACT|nr:DUF4347 domain-containing protein [Rubripirellula reticaptiva]TWU49211.1 Cadherin domain protein [Rubripirellula reticaptiva]
MAKRQNDWRRWLMSIDEWSTRGTRLFARPQRRCGLGPQLRLSSLEPRILFSATPIDFSAMDGQDQAAMVMEVEPEQSDESATAESVSIAQLAASDTSQPTELVFINSDVANIDQILDDLGASEKNYEVFVLEADRDGIDQINEILDGRSEVSSLHLFSHAENGAVRLGNVSLGSNNLAAHASQIALWQSALTSSADILIYGCDLAATEDGRYLIDAIGTLTEADVAASDDDTGHASFGGNWNLEFATGSIETEIATSAQLQQDWLGKLSTITVTTFADTINGSDGVTSLREAIIAASSGDTIVLGTGTYVLAISGTGENSTLTGDLDINKSLTIIGNGAGNTIIDGGAQDRVFHIDNVSATVAFSELTIQNGFTTGNGGAVYIEDGTVNLNRVAVQSNRGAFGAGIYVNTSATLNLTDVVIQNNGDGGTTRGGGIDLDGTASLLRVTISGNQAGSGGGIYNSGTLDMSNATLGGNNAFSSGGGVYSTGTTSITNSTIAFNNGGSGGGIRRQGGSTSIVNTIISNNSASSANADVQGSFNSLGFNLIQDVTGGSGFVGSDIVGSSANLGSLTDNGGFGKTHAITTSSLAYNAGTTTGAPTNDQRGVERSSLVDIGAFELRELSSTSEFRVNTTTSSTQETSGQDRGSQQSVAMADDGSYVVVWSSLNQDGDGWGVYARRFDSSGMALTGEITVADLPANNQKWARVGSADDGSFVVTWTLTDALDLPQDVYAQRFDASGNALGANFVVNTTTSGTQSNSSIAVNGSGDFIVAWEGNGVGETDGIFYRRFNANGTAIDGTEIRANFDDLGDENEASVAINDSGQFAIAWESAGEIYVRHFAAGGTALHDDVMVDSNVAPAMGPTVAIDSLGRAVVVYRTNGLVGLGAGVWGRSFNTDGTERLSLFQVSNQSFSSDNTQPSIAMADNGDFVVVYHGDDNGDGDGSSVKFRRYDADSGAIAAASQVNISTTGDQQFASVAMLDMDNFVVTWSGNGTQSGNTDTSGVFSRQFHLESPTLDLDANNSSGTSGNDFAQTFVNGGGAVSVADTDATIIDFDSTHLQSLTIKITDRQNGANEVLSANTSGTSITANYSAGTLTLSGSDTLARYQQVLRTVTYNNSINPATGTSRTITFVANDGISVSEVATTTLTISMPVNLAPTDIAISNSTVNENTNTTGGNSIGVLSATDADSSAPFTWAVVGGADQARFSIGGASNNELILTDGVLDYETKSSYVVDVRVTDSSGNPFIETLTISVTDINEAPTVSLSLATTTLAEDTDTTSAIVVSTITVTDDALGTNTLTLSGSDASLFEIVGNDLRLIAGAALDFETKSTLDVTVNVNDPAVGGSPDDTASHTLTITDVNEAPSVSLTPVITTLSEDTDTTSAIVVATITITDDALGNETLSLSGLDAAFFEIVGNDLRLKAGVNLDFETNPTLNVTVEIDDATISGSPDDSAGHSVTITDVVETPTQVLTPSNDTYLNKNQSDFNYGISETLVIDHLGGSIGDSRILLQFDFSSIPVGATITGANLTMQATAGSGVFDIGVYEVTESWVQGNQDGATGFPSWDNRTNTATWNGGTFDTTAVATFNATTTGQHAWNITTLVQEWVMGSTVNHGLILGSENTSGNSYTYSSSEGASAPQLQLFYTVTNAAPTDIAPNTFSVTENTDTTAGISLGGLTATDSDVGETFTWVVVGGADETKFTINGSNELVLSDGIVDFERQGSYSVVVRVIDSATNIYDETLTIDVTDQNEAPSISLTPIVTNLDENTDTSSAITIATIVISDDALGSETLTLSGNDAAMFEIVGNELRVIANASLDFETNDSLDVTVNIDDPAIAGNPDDSANYTVTVNNINESPVVTLTPVVANLDEDTDTTSAIVVATITVTDDSVGSETLSLSGADAAMFEIVGNQLRLIAGASLNFESNASLDVSVDVDDTSIPGSPDNSAAHTITVGDINEAPSISLTPIVTNLDENTDTSTAIVIATIVISDDGLGSETLTLSGDDAASFEIVGNELRLIANASLDFETNDSLDVTVSIDDPAIAGNPEDSASYNVNIGPSNEAPTGINLDNSSVAESAAGAFVGTLTAIDPDAGDLHTWSVDDARFEIIAGQLKLKSTESLAFDTEPTVNVIVRATDIGGLFRDASFVLTVNARESSTVPLLPSGLLPDASKSTDSTSTSGDSDDDSGKEASSDSDSDKNVIVSGIVTSKNSDDDDDDKPNMVMPTAVEASYTSSTVAQSSNPAALAAILSQDGSDIDSRNSLNEEDRQSSKDSESRSNVLDTQSELTQSQLNYILLTQPGAMWNELDQHRNQLESQIQGDLIVVGATGAAASSVTVGVIAWALRSGVLASGLLAQMPAWRAVDPLLIMQGSGEKSDNESLEELMARRSEALDNQSNNDSDGT